jgi:hypothetical protein
MSRRIVCLTFILAFIICACAKISSPSGGARDTKPPVVVNTVPLYGTKNFKGHKIEIMFDEYVVLDNINEKFMVSPPMKIKPKVYIKGKGVNIEFEGKLKDSTTYTFYFQDAIKDLNEGNILQNYQFVLSTGAVIDSLSVTGNIYNAYNLEVPEKTIVILYREMADSAVEKHLPEYISRAGSNGYFRINNVRPGIYKLYGLKDADNSKNYNLQDEEFAFMDSTVVITPQKNYIPPLPVIKDTASVLKKAIKKATGVKDTTNLKKKEVKVAEPVLLKGEYRLFQFTGPKKSHYLTSSKRDLKYQMLFILSLPPDSMSFDFSIPGAGRNSYFTEYSKNRDSLKVWLSDSSLYTQPEIKALLKFPFTDTLGRLGYKQDTIQMRYLTPKPPRSAKIKRTVFTFDSDINSGYLKPGQSIVFKSKTPFREPDTSLIRLYEIVDNTRQEVGYQIMRDTSNSCKYFLKTKLAQGKKYFFLAEKASFGNIYNEYSDSLGIKFTIKDPESYCKLTMEIKNYKGNRIIQLLDKSEKLVAENYMKSDGKTVFPLLESGFYRLKVIFDLNGDGKWTTGDFALHRQPEPVSYYPSEIEFKTGWELEFTGEKAWDISLKNFKDPKLLEVKKGK